ncbi:PIN domain-containing protein [Prauserella muralis]|uniref:Ribonuclease VapC n=1 Tax=Prauserella muralis TaxID=588067 RepID=A0A2V4AZQ1_9PSEU|nr:PIN domain-containing protein [Prauserella muralis]PXY27480.1 twitching motility protein PilT [Prauserella muralis]TWE22808.1 putative nucleic acid-binding protein [Prauserella muralis]
MIVIADTSGLLAAIDRDDKEHNAARTAIARASLLVISPMVLAELDYLVAKHFGEDTAMAVSDNLATRTRKRDYEIAEITADLLVEAKAVRSRYRSLELGLTDAANVVLAARYSTDAILTLDRRHFRTAQPIAGVHTAFRLLPDDLEA